MTKDTTTNQKAKPAGQNSAGTGAGVTLAIRVTKNAMLYGGCHHAKGKLLKVPKAAADELIAQGCAELIPGVA